MSDNAALVLILIIPFGYWLIEGLASAWRDCGVAEAEARTTEAEARIAEIKGATKVSVDD